MLMLVKFPDGKLSNELVYDREKYADAEIIGPALIDPVLNRVELAGWLKLIDGKVEIDAAKKREILDSESAASQLEQANKSEIGQLRQSLQQLSEDIKGATTVAQIKSILIQLLKFIYLQNKG